MAVIYSYLTFFGKCREAMDFYKTCLGGELTIQKVGDTPLSNDLPAEFRELVLQSILRNDKLVLMATDMVDEDYLIAGNTISMMLYCDNENDARSYYRKLSKGGKKISPLTFNQTGSLTGALKDKYGNQWIIRYFQPTLV